MKVQVTIKRRPQISDPQGTAVGRGLRDLGYDVGDVRIDRTVELEVPGSDENEIRSTVSDMCQRLLANPVMEDYEIELRP